jgi:hypothetical protein
MKKIALFCGALAILGFSVAQAGEDKTTDKTETSADGAKKHTKKSKKADGTETTKTEETKPATTK